MRETGGNLDKLLEELKKLGEWFDNRFTTRSGATVEESEPGLVDIERVLDECLEDMMQAYHRLTGSLFREQAGRAMEQIDRPLSMRDQRFSIIDEAQDIPEGFLLPGCVEVSHRSQEDIIRQIPMPPVRRVIIPEGYVLIDGSNQNVSIGAETRGLVIISGRQAGRGIEGADQHLREILAMGDGPGCSEWIRGYRDDRDLKRFYYVINNLRNAPEKLEERRKLMAQHLKGEHD